VDVVNDISAPRAQMQLTTANGQQLSSFKNACLACHDEDVIRQQRLTRAQWEREIQKMTNWGARMSDEDRERFLDYLLSNYGPRSGVGGPR
jgi:hypothetical protein